MGSAESGTTPDFHSSNLRKLDSMVTQNKEKEQANQLLLKTVKANSANNLFINSPGAQQYQKIYEQSGGKIQKFFDLIEVRISDLYISLSKQTLEFMCERRLTNTESKVFISEQILYTSMNILKILGAKTNFKYDPLTISRLNSLQLCMLGYMKAKYPRQSQNFVPGELMQEFKNFDLVEQPQNDVLKHLNVYFGEKNQDKLMMQVKKFINKLIDQLDSKFTIFQQLLSKKVFVVTKEGRQYTVFNKIGRKIPENVDKLNQQDQSSIDLKSPEIFRVIVKWVNDMEDYILHPDEEIKQKDHFKTVKIVENQICYDYITTDEIEDQLESLQSKLMVEKQQYEDSLQNLKNYIQLFNHNLIKVITKAERREKYVPRREAEIIKYSMFNKKLLSWLIIQKLMIVLKKLIKTSETLEESVGFKLDLIKFNVTDLMRAMMVGNKFEILKVFINLKNLEEEGSIKILKIKNRLETPLNDAMIIFKIKESFIICELQLVLSDGNQSVTEKLKNIETLNHFFYELERSPYGVMAELSALLSFKDNKTNFQSKIRFEKIPEFNLGKCRATHPQKIQMQNFQKNPFICSQCTQFYGEYQNQYIFEYCQQCNQYECAKCLFQEKKYSEQALRLQAIQRKISREAEKLTQQQQNYVRTYQSVLYKSAEFANNQKTIKKVNDFISKQNSCPFRQIAKKKNIISFKELQKYINQKYRKLTLQKQMIYFSACKFIGKDLYFTILKDHFIDGISFCFDYNFDPEVKHIEFNYFDFILVHKVKKEFSTLQKYSNLNLFHNYSMPKQTNQKEMTIQYLKVTEKKQLIELCNVVVIIDIMVKQKGGQDQSYQDGSFKKKKQFQYESIEDLRKNLPNLTQTQQVMNLGNEGITDSHLHFFQKVPWRSRIKYLNLHNNKINDANILVVEMPNLQTLIISKNYLSQLVFKAKLPNFRKLVAFQNLISELQGVQNISTASTINLASNRLNEFTFKKVPFINLRILDLENNQLSIFQPITQKECPKIISLVLNGNGNEEKVNQALKLDLPRLVSLKLIQYKAISIQIHNVRNLENLTLNSITASSLIMGEANCLKQFTLRSCRFPDSDGDPRMKLDAREQRFIYKTLQKQFSSLLSLVIQAGWEIYELPVLKMPQVKNIEIKYVVLESIMNLCQSKLPNLESLSLLSVQIKQIPVLNFPKLAKIEINADSISDASNISLWNLPNLSNLKISYLDENTPIFSFNNLTIKDLYIDGGTFTKNLTLQSDTVEVLTIYEADCENFPVLEMPKLQKLHLANCMNVNLSSLEKSKLDRLITFDATNLMMKQQYKSLPALNCASLDTIQFLGCYIEDISSLSISNLPSLKRIVFQNGQFLKFPALSCPSLCQITMNYCQITDLGGISQSSLPNLTKLTCSFNKIKQLPIMALPKLQQIQLDSCGLEDITSLQFAKLPCLKKLILKGDNNIQNFCHNTSLPALEELDLPPKYLKNIEGLGSSHFNKLRILDLVSVKLDIPSLPKLDMPGLMRLNIEESNIEDILMLEHSNLKQLAQLELNNTKIIELPVMKLPKLNFIKCNSTKKPQGQDQKPQQVDQLENEPVNDEINAKKTTNNKKKRTRLWSIKNLKYSELPELTLLQLEYNQIVHLPKLKFPKLKKIFLWGNRISDLTEFKQSWLPSLELLNIYDNKIKQLPIGMEVKPTSLYMNQAEVSDFNELVDFAPIAENFFYNCGKMPQVWPNATFKRVKIFQLNMCSLKVIDDIFKNTFEKLVELSISDNQIERVPQLFCPSLQNLYLNRNCINNVKEFVKSEFPCAKMISLQSNQLEDLVDFPFAVVADVYLSHNKFTDISFMSKYQYETMRMLVLWDVKLVKLCKLNAPLMEKIYMNVNCIESLESMQGSNLPNVTLLNFSDNKIKDLSPLNHMKLSSVSSIYMSNNKVTKMCTLNLPTLSILQLKQNPINNVEQFAKSQLNMYQLSLSFDCTQALKIQHRKKLESFPLYESNYVP